MLNRYSHTCFTVVACAHAHGSDSTFHFLNCLNCLETPMLEETVAFYYMPLDIDYQGYKKQK